MRRLRKNIPYQVSPYRGAGLAQYAGPEARDSDTQRDV